MTHVLFLHSSAELYGSDRSLRSLVRAAREAHLAVTVVIPDEGPLVAELTALGATVLRLPLAVVRRAILHPRGLWSFLGSLRSTRRSFGWLRDIEGPVHIVSNTSAVVTGFQLASRGRHDHTVIVREFFKPGLELRAFRWLVSRANRVIGVSRAVADQFPGVPVERRFVVYSGGDLTDQAVVAGDHDGPVRILCPGRLNAWKGQDVLLDALSEIGPETPTHTRIIGGEYGGTTIFAEALRDQIASLPDHHQVELVGELPGLDAEYEWSDIVVVPSKRAEPFGKVVIEGMNHSRPVISTLLGGPAEVISTGADGLLVAPDSPGELAHAIRELADDPARRRELGGAAFQTSLRFDASAAARRIVAIVTGEAAATSTAESTVAS